MNRWTGLTLSLLATTLLAACATQPYSRHYQPSGYYHSPGYVVDYRYSSGYSGAYYPWWSVDYFYFGSHYYPPVYYRTHHHYPLWYGHYDGYSHYPGIGSGWFYRPPYYSYGAYDPWWRYRYRTSVYRPPGQDARDVSAGDRPPTGADRDSMTRPGHRAGIVPGERDRKTVRRERTRPPDRATLTERRGVPATARRTDERGMVVIGGGDNKIRPSRPEPIERVEVPPRPAVTAQPPQNTSWPGVAAPPRSTGASPGRQTISAPPRKTMNSTVRQQKPAGSGESRERPAKRARSDDRGDDGDGKGRSRGPRVRDYQ